MNRRTCSTRYMVPMTTGNTRQDQACDVKILLTPENLLPLIARRRITSFFAPPTIWISLLRSPLFEATDLSSLQKGYYGASIMPVE